MRTPRAVLCLATVAASAAAARADEAADAAQRARDAVTRVFSRPEFDPLAKADRIPRPEVDAPWLREVVEWMQRAMKSVLEAFIDFLRWLFGGAGRLFSGSGAPGGGSGTTARILAWGLGALAVAVVLWLLVRLMRANAAERRARTSAVFGAPEPGGEDDALAHTPDEWRRSATTLSSQGRRRESIRALYLSLLSALHHAGAIDYDRSRTNTAYDGDVRNDHAAKPGFRSLTRRFDDAWYGLHEPSEEELGRAVAEADVVLRAFVTGAVHV